MDREKRRKTLNEIKPVQNMIKNRQSSLEINPVGKEISPSHKLEDYIYE